MKGIIGALSLVLLFLVAPADAPSWAGTPNALVTGSVFDQLGAPVAGATVRLINGSIGFRESQTTDTRGWYTFTSVPPAENFLLSVEKTGFAPAIYPSLTVQVGEERLVLPPFSLEPAAQPGEQLAKEEGPKEPSKQRVEQPPQRAPSQVAKKVSKAPSVSVDLLTMTVGAVVDSRFVHTLPLVGRDFIDLALLVPGTYPVEQRSVLEGASLVVNGVRANMNTFLLDGADNNDYTINQSLPFQIVEAMQEFRVQAATSPAEFGRNGGAQINTISRRGTNTLHGTLFEFHRNSALSASNFFSAYNGGTFDHYIRDLELLGLGNPLSDSTLASLYDTRNPEVIQNQFGGNVGGALAKDKLFGFFNWESFRVANPRPLFERVPGDALRSASSCPAFVGLQPPAQCDPVALALYNLYGARNVPTSSLSTQGSSPFPFTDPNVNAFFVGKSQNGTESDNFLSRIDWRVNAQATMSFKHNIQLIRQVQGGDTPQTQTYPGNGTRVRGRNQNFSYNYVHQFSRTTNEFRYGWNRFRLTTTALDAGIDPATLGFQNLDFHNKGLPTLTVGGSFATFAPFSVLGADLGTPSKRANNVWSWADNVSLTRGRNTWKFGGEFRNVRLNVTNEALGRGLITFFNGPFGAAGAPDLASIARVCPAFLASIAPVFSQICPQFGTGFDRAFSTQSYNAYAQDQWRPFHNFTLNYGIRYEVNTAPVERRDRLVNFYPALKGWVRANSTTIFDPFANVIGTAPRPAPRAGFETDKNDWSPRIGFAWDPWNNGKAVVRGSYALVYDQQPLEPSVNMLLNPPFVQEVFSFRPFFALKDTFEAPNSQWFRAPYSTAARDPNTLTAYVHQFHLGVEQQFGSRGVLEVAYVGSAGHKLPRLRDISACKLDIFFQDPSTCFSFNQTPLLFASVLSEENTANSIFHSLQVRFDARNFHGLQMRLFYQWAKSIDNASSLQPQVFTLPPFFADFLVCCGFFNQILNPETFAGLNNVSPTLSLRPVLPIITTRPRLPQDSSNIAGERGLSDFDVRHRFVANYIYDVPGWAPGIGVGWQLAGIVTAQSGQPYTVFVDFFGIPFRPNIVGNPVINNGNPNAAIDNGNFPSFTRPGSFKINFDPKTGLLLPGNLGRNTFSGPGLLNFDFSIVKNTHLGSEQRNLQFRAEFFNLFNTTHFRQPYSDGGVLFTNTFDRDSTVFFDPFFSKILQARPAREVQFALKLIF